jgi:hypothetical protein
MEINKKINIVSLSVTLAVLAIGITSMILFLSLTRFNYLSARAKTNSITIKEDIYKKITENVRKDTPTEINSEDFGKENPFGPRN